MHLSSAPRRRSTTVSNRVIPGVDLTGAGARPGVLRRQGSTSARDFDGRRFAQLVRTADRALLDLVTLDEGFLLSRGRRRVADRLDAAVAAARVAPHTRGIELVAAVGTRQLEPTHVAATVSSIDRARPGWAGWPVPLRKTAPLPDHEWTTRAELDVEAVTRGWDGQSVQTGDGAGVGPVAELPPGRPPVIVRVRSEVSEAFAGRTADIARIAVADVARTAHLCAAVRDAALAADRSPDAVRVVVDAYVVLATDRESARARLELVEATQGPVTANALVVADMAAGLATLITDWHAAGAVDGFLLRPSALGPDLDAIGDHLLPELRRAGDSAPSAARARCASRSACRGSRMAAPAPVPEGERYAWRRLRPRRPSGAPRAGSSAPEPSTTVLARTEVTMAIDTPTEATPTAPPGDGESRAAWTAWHAARERDLAAPHGWLSLVAYHWLPAAPGRLPSVPGSWWADDEGAHVRPDDPTEARGPLLVGEALRDSAADTVLEEGHSVVLGSYLPPGRARGPVARSAALEAVTRDRDATADGSRQAAQDPHGETAAVAVELVRRTGRYAIRLRDPHAPARASFTGVPTYPYDDSWVRHVPLRRYPEPRSLVVGAARPGLVHHVQAVGEIDLTDGHRTSTLMLTGTGSTAILVFSDEADGIAPWRALRVDLPQDVPPGTAGTVRIDLNRGVNLPYAFSDHGTCPAPPAGNHVPFAVTAGERAPR